jgi:hypothetical protein
MKHPGDTKQTSFSDTNHGGYKKKKKPNASNTSGRSSSSSSSSPRANASDLPGSGGARQVGDKIEAQKSKTRAAQQQAKKYTR